MSSNEKWCYILKDKRLKLAKWTCREEVLLQDGFPGQLTSRRSWACNFIKDCLAMNIWEWRRKQNQPREIWCCKASPTSGSRARMILQGDWGLGWYGQASLLPHGSVTGCDLPCKVVPPWTQMGNPQRDWPLKTICW